MHNPREPWKLDLAEIAECIATAGVFSLLPQFPRASGEQQPMPEYRHDAQKRMRQWVRFQLSDLEPFPIEEREARIILEHYATMECARRLYASETRLIMECARDLITAHIITKELAEQDARADTAERLHRPGRLFA